MPSRPSLRAGDRLGKYLVQGPFGDGVLGALFLAAHGKERFTVEVLAPTFAEDSGFVGRVEREVRLAARVSHPNVLGASDVVRSEGMVAIATPYRPGPPVEALYPGGALHVEITPALVAWIGAECAAGLSRAHTMSTGAFVHRGVSPGAIRVGLDGRVRITDFGLADAMRGLGKRAPVDPSVLAPYLAPEQIEGGPPDPRWDLWSLGVVLWELLARSRLFRRESRAETLEAIQYLEVPPLDEIREDVPLELEDAIRRAVERDPSKRWPTAKWLEDALRANVPEDVGAVRAPLLAAMGPAAQEERARTSALPPLSPEGVDRPGGVPKAVAAPVMGKSAAATLVGTPVAAPVVGKSAAPPVVAKPSTAPVPAAPSPTSIAAVAAPTPPVPDPARAPASVAAPAPPAPIPARAPASVAAVAAPMPPAPKPVTAPPPIASAPLPTLVPSEPEARGIDRTPQPMPPPSRPRRTGLVALVLGVFVFAGVIGLLVLLFPDESAQTASAEPAGPRSAATISAATAAPALAPAGTPAPATASEVAPTTASIRVEANRMQAWVEVDGGARLDLPTDIDDLTPGTLVHLRIGAPGYLPRTAEAVAGETRRVRLWLGRPGETEPGGTETAGTGEEEDGPAEQTFRPLDERPSGDLERNPFGN